MPVADWEPIDWRKRLDVKQARRGKEAEAAMIKAKAFRTQVRTEATTAGRRFGPGGLVGEELSRRYPHGIPAKEAETARITAKGTTGYYGRMAGVEEERLRAERKQAEFARGYLSRTGVLPSQAAAGGAGGDQVSRIKRIAEEEEETVAAPSGRKCARGYFWNGRKCVPRLMAD